MENSGQHTIGHVACPACEESRLLMVNPGDLKSLLFPEAARLWLQNHRRHVSPTTANDYEKWIRLLARFFGQLTLEQIHAGHFEEYQNQRLTGDDSLTKAGPVCINHELGVLCQILKRANLWGEIAPHYQPLRIPKSTRGAALTQEEEERLFRAAASNPRWAVAYFASVLTANTTAGPGEIRNLRIRDVSLGDSPSIHIREGIKNEYRERVIPLNDAAREAVSRLVARAAELGAIQPQHYLLPHRAENGKEGADPNRPMYGWRKAWEKLRDAAGLPDLRPNDLRHHAITKLLSQPDVSERTVIEIAGHVGRRMLDKYSKIRKETKLHALQSLSRKGPEPEPRPSLRLIKR